MGAIGPRGFHTNLIRVEGSLTAEGYARMLVNHNVQAQIINRLGLNFIFQQDNARPHTAKRIQNILDRLFPHRLDWPAKSPDLSPIEQI